jgi:hydroxyacylglutathione hydrolase
LQITVDELRTLTKNNDVVQILDVRRPPEYQSGHVPRALHVPLSHLEQSAAGLPVDPTKPTAVICAGGYRSSAATSILKQHGFANLLNVTGGTTEWIDAGYPVEIPPLA